MKPNTSKTIFGLSTTAKKLLLGLLLAVSFWSCSTAIGRLFGFRPLEGLDKERYVDFIAQTPHSDTYVQLVSDSAQYATNIALGSGAATEKEFGQPVRVLFFKNAMLTASNAVYCYSSHHFIRKRDTAMQQRFSVFPPQSYIVVDTLQLGLERFSAIYPEIGQVPTKKHIVLIFWTLMVEKLSTSTITTVHDYITSFGKSDDTAIILINSDLFWASYLDD